MPPPYIPTILQHFRWHNGITIVVASCLLYLWQVGTQEVAAIGFFYAAVQLYVLARAQQLCTIMML